MGPPSAAASTAGGPVEERQGLRADTRRACLQCKLLVSMTWYDTVLPEAIVTNKDDPKNDTSRVASFAAKLLQGCTGRSWLQTIAEGVFDPGAIR